MNHARSSRARRRLTALVVALGLLLVGAAVTGVLVARSAPTALADALDGAATAADGQGVDPADDGELPDGATVFDDGYAGIAKLDPELLGALRAAAGDAGPDDVDFIVNSGWRSPEYQQELLDEAVAEYGSVEEAARWVATPERSAHVAGEAVDVGLDATVWLADHGAEYGLCQIYDNEAWHFELRPEAVDAGCPEKYWDPTFDPRLQG
ncbi:M15 family metallopeptidase [Agromyces endophyticus]|uniref:M15 family metallopeptidase n=1 Tax=Agromyces sp. H17E-10 TaxID=2932244 RepID=UPI001FD40452|nr:M15 family metallopeptidase [Agromyces sp. H17E-10]UOQ90304.1 M15 family metallopeptidase [Agromyces sp. H17E-10]